MICKCEEGTWGTENKNPICRHPVYTETVLCLNCAHDKDCHEPESSIPPHKRNTTKGKLP
jgi:hypothetical protein